MNQASLGMLLAFFVVGWGAPGPVRADQEVELPLDVTLERSLTPGDTHSYRVPVSPGEFVQVVVDQRGIDVVLSIHTGDGKVRRSVDLPTADHGEEVLSWITFGAGDLHFQVTASDPDAPSGAYTIRLRERRPPDAADAKRVRAEEAFARGSELLYQDSAETRRGAIGPFREALALWRELGDRRFEALTLYSLARTENSLGRAGEAVDLYARALEAWRVVGDRRSIAETQFALAHARWIARDVEAARTGFHESLELARAVSDDSLAAEILASLGNLEDSVGEEQQALAAFERGLPIARAARNRNAECRLLQSAAAVRDFLGEPQRALDGYREVLTLCRSISSKSGQAHVLASIGRLYVDLGETSIGLEHLASAAALAGEVGDKRSRARILYFVGRGRAQSGDGGGALAAYSEARDMWRDVGDAAHEGAARGLMAAVLASRGDESASAEFDRALELARRAKSPLVESEVLGGRGRYRADRGETAAAWSDLSAAASIQRRLGDRLGEARSRFDLARVERASGNLDAASGSAAAALDLIEGLRTEVASQELRATFFATAQQTYDFAIDLAMDRAGSEPGKGFDAGAWSMHERSRARSLLDLLRARDSVRGRTDPALLERERALRKRITRAIDDPSRVLGDPWGAVSAGSELEALRSEYDRVRETIQASSPRYAALAFGEPSSIESVQSELDSNTLLFEYRLAEPRSFLWVIGRSSFETFVLPSRSAIESTGRDLYRALQSAKSSWRSAASKLSAQVLAPAGERHFARTLLIVPDGILRLIPFGVLGSRDASDAMLVSRSTLVEIPSASVLSSLRVPAPRRRSSDRVLAIIADPVLDVSDPRVHATFPAPLRSVSAEGASASAEEPMPRLAFTRREAMAIGELVPSRERRIALDFDANLDLALSGELADYRFLHFATHAVAGSDRPDRAGLVLSRVTRDGRSRDGLLAVPEIFNLRLSSELVVLSACQTALGRDVQGEGLMGLARAFLYAGATRIVASLWRVDDIATAELMTRFYRAMLGPDRLAPAAALREAQTSIAATPRWAHPYYWAGFVLQGDWR